MSAIAERALIFYLSNPEVIDELEVVRGQAHKVYSCPECSSSVVIREGEIVSLSTQPGVLLEEELELQQAVMSDLVTSSPDPGEESLVPCR